MSIENEKHVPGSERSLDLVKWGLVFALLSVIVVGNSYYSDEVALLYRAVIGVVLVVVAGAIALATQKGRQFNGFWREAAVELRKIVWPTRPETIQTTLIVFVVVFFTAIILYLLDLLLGFVVSKIIG